MANFNTHFTSAVVVSGLMSTMCLQVGLVDSNEAMILVLAGAIGGILPDIDLHYSYPSRILFSLLGIVLSFLWVLTEENNLSIMELWSIGLLIFVFIRYGLWWIFNKYTTHRGAIHSLAAAVLCAIASSALVFHAFGKTPFVSWLVAFFVFIGFCLHLLLDEMYSVDFMNRRVKRSFGTAMKLIDTRHEIASSVIAVLAVGLWFFTPPAGLFFDTLFSPQTYLLIWHRMLPAGIMP